MRHFVFGLLLVSSMVMLAPAQGVITTIAGTDGVFIADNVPALQSRLAGTAGFGLASDADGNVYIADSGNQAIFKVTPSGALTTVAGNGIVSYSGDGGPARSASFSFPQGIVLDGGGNIYLADYGNHSVRKITRDGLITTIAGNGIDADAGDGGLAISASISYPDTLAIDAAGNLYVAHSLGTRVRKITPDGIITTVAGTGVHGFSGDGGLATEAAIDGPKGLAVDAAGNLYISDSDNYRIRRVTPDGIINTIAGGGDDISYDDTLALSAAIYPAGLSIDRTGILYFADLLENRIAKVTRDGTLVTVVGNGEQGDLGDGGPALSASLTTPYSITFDPNGNLYVAGLGNGVIRRVTPSGSISRFAGTGNSQFGGDGGPANLALFNSPESIALDESGRVYIADLFNHRVRRLEKDGTVQTIAGTGALAILSNGDGGDARQAQLFLPAGVAVDKIGNIYVSESNAIRKISTNGMITTIAGGGLSSFAGDNGPAVEASLNNPTFIKVDSAGNLYVADAGNDRIRRIDPAGVITTYAGGGATLGDGGSAVQASLKLTGATDDFHGGGLALDSSGNLFIADTYHHRIRKVTPEGIISSVAGNGNPGYSGDNGPAINASLNAPFGLAFDNYGKLLITDQGNNRIRIVSGGVITTVAGDGRRNFSGDGGLAVNASLWAPSDVAVDRAGNVLIVDQIDNRIREILASPPTVDVTTTSLTFSATSGGAPSDPKLLTVNSAIPGLLFPVWTSTVSGGPWLTVDPSAGATPRLITVTANPANLAPGTYQGTVTIPSTYTFPQTLNIKVTFNVLPGPPPSLSVDKQNVSFTFPKSGTPRTEVISVQNTGSGSLDFNPVAATSSGGNWLTLSVGDRKVTPVAPSVVAITADPTGLAPGTYSGQVTISAANGDSRVVFVAMTVSEAEKALLLTQTGLSFTAVQGGGVVPPQTFGVVNVGNGTIQWSVTPSTLSGGSQWLSVTPGSGVTNAGDAAPLAEVRVDPAGLSAGSYYGLLRVDYGGDNPQEAANSPQFVTVFLEVQPRGSNPPPVIEPTELTFTGVEGEGFPGSKDIVIYNPSEASKTFRSVVSTGADNFTLISPVRDGTLLPGQPTRISVQPRVDNPNPSSSGRSVLGLRAGVYTRELSFQFSDGTVKTVNVKLIVAPAGSQVSQSRFQRRAVGCVPKQLVPSLTSLGQAFAVSAGWPVAINVEVLDDCGTPLDTGFVSVSFSNGDSPVLLQSLKQGQWQGSWSARNSSVSQVTLKVEAVNPAVPVSGIREISGDLRSAQDAPFAEKDSIFSAAGLQRFVPLAPGSIITISGDRLAESNASAQTGPAFMNLPGTELVIAGVPLPTNLAGTEVVMAGISLPLLSVSQKQINAVVPNEIKVNTSQQLLIRRGNTLSKPIAVDVAAAQPAIFVTSNGNPIVFNGSPGAPDAAPVNTRPAGSGDSLVIFTSGLGVTNPIVGDGLVSPSDPAAATKDPVSVSIGGVQAQVVSAALIPGLVALYQINVTVPSDLPGGDQLPVSVSVSGQTSPQVMIPVRH